MSDEVKAEQPAMTMDSFRESFANDVAALAPAPAEAPVETVADLPQPVAEMPVLPAAATSAPAPMPAALQMSPEIIQAIQAQGAMRFAQEMAARHKAAQDAARTQAPVDPVKAFYDDYRLPERQKDENEEAYAQRMFLSSIAHGNAKIDAKVEALRRENEALKESLMPTRQWHEQQAERESQQRFMSLFDKTMEGNGFKKGHPHLESAREYALSMARSVAPQAGQWGEKEWSGYLSDLGKKAAKFWPAPAPVPVGTPVLQIVPGASGKPAIAPLGEGSGGAGQDKVGGTTPAPKNLKEFKAQLRADVSKLARG